MTRYRVGIDVGLNSVGFAAIEIDGSDRPLRLLSSLVHIHDAGVDPLQNKTRKTRLAESGVARRTRRLLQRRRKRLKALDRLLLSKGWPITNLEDHADPWLPWKTRALLVAERIEGPERQGAALAIALRHMARHRGWRNPWTSVASLRANTEPSEYLQAFRDRVSASLGRELVPNLTPAELVELARGGPSLKLRGEGSLIGGKLHQSDNVLELRAIAETQGLDEATFVELTDAVFAAKSPRGAAAERAGRDPLPGRSHEHRAAKATIAFQRFRIAAAIANIRIAEGGLSPRTLTVPERKALMSRLEESAEPVTWTDVAEFLGFRRRQLIGTATSGMEGDLVATRPPVNVTHHTMQSAKSKPLRLWWASASAREREALVRLLSNAGDISEESAEDVAANTIVESLPEAELAKLDSLHFPAGRAAYSERSLRELTLRMLETEDDLHAARKALFGVSDTWSPPVERVGEPVGNPAVDRVLKIVARWLSAAEAAWGAPESINVEHVREAFSSAATAAERIRGDERRYRQRKDQLAEIHERLGISGVVKTSDVRRFQAIQRQNGQCLYCGDPITFATAEMDHIVPRAGVGSSNTRDNLVAVCRPCNASKSNTLFSVWAADSERPGVGLGEALARVDHFLDEDGLRGLDRKRFRDGVKRRLRATEEDEPIDNRSIESVAWMANQLHLRLKSHFSYAETKVAVYRGQITALARRASGLEGRIELIGRQGKTRLDRRHHAVDAAVAALLRPAVAATLAERDNLRTSQRVLDIKPETWKEYRGQGGNRILFERWLTNMDDLTDLLNQALREDRIPLTESKRLRLGSSAAHDDTIKKLKSVQLSSAMPSELIDRASSPQLWCALVNQPDFDSVEGLPSNPLRRIRVVNRWYGPQDHVGFFEGRAAAIAVRGGSAEIGNTIHHARIYHVVDGKRSYYAMLRVFQVDLLRNRSDDLFSVDLPPQAISIRTAAPRLRRALTEGKASYLGWLVEGDELVLDLSSQTSSHIAEFLSEYPGTRRWRVAGFPSDARLRLRPQLLAAEGLPEDSSPGTVEIVEKGGWRPSVDVCFGKCRPTVVRRDSLGRVRLESSAHLPVTWEARKA